MGRLVNDLPDEVVRNLSVTGLQGREKAGFSAVENAIFSISRAINETRAGRFLQNVYLRTFCYFWISRALSRWMLVEGLENITGIEPDGGVLLVSNHRSLFDFFAVCVPITAARTGWLRRFCFPVRSEFFYEKPLGFLVNLVAGGCVMYPPIFRQPSRARRNKQSVDYLIDILKRKGWMVGFHPEGMRNKSADAYRLLPVKPGVGEIALKSGAIVVPVFVNGLGNNFLTDVRRGFNADADRNPCICVFGEPIDARELAQTSDNPRGYKKLAERFGEAIVDLGKREKELREQCATTGIAKEDPRWLRTMLRK